MTKRKGYEQVTDTCMSPGCTKPLIFVSQKQLETKFYCSFECRYKDKETRRYTSKACAICNVVFNGVVTNQIYCRRCIPDKAARSVWSKYGISRPMYEAMMAAQNGLCDICRKRPATMIDHDHRSGELRSLLCRPCNTALGALFDDPDLIRRAAAYVEDHMVAQSETVSNEQ